MRIKSYILLVLFCSLALVAARPVHAQHEDHQVIPIKAAFIYNFIKFVDWPNKARVDANEPITIGIIGSEDFSKAFGPVKSKKIKDRSISIKYFAGYEKLEIDDPQWDEKMNALRGCDVLMCCTCNSVRVTNSTEIVKALKGVAVLTIGDTGGFLESGGMINFVTEDGKLRFEINATAVKKANLKMSAQLLRLARRVIEEEASGEARD